MSKSSGQFFNFLKVLGTKHWKEDLAIEFHFIRGRTISERRNNHQGGNTTAEQQVWKGKKDGAFC